MNLPNKLRQWRKRAKLTQEAAAQRLGAPRRTYEKWEQGLNAPRGMALALLLERIR